MLQRSKISWGRSKVAFALDREVWQSSLALLRRNAEPEPIEGTLRVRLDDDQADATHHENQASRKQGTGA
ncbi:hypothetical protein FV222_13940 [Methylobacterium sp. WL103]|uniref:hypothetical protein n=1 Tax=Methylobacterium TaxID=407 RepID=UPI0011C9A1DF|nr:MULTISPECIES: hypothetical protein [Methylobacterium]TXM98769.1 hypothetical protein FV222_13940 [Methylobacterium sp. WL103]TXN07216.1 hypothetical protein FV219_08520 [Methylobacterium sp. WL122]